MKIGLLHPWLPSQLSPDDALILDGLGRLVAGAELTHFHSADAEKDGFHRALNHQDGIILCAETASPPRARPSLTRGHLDALEAPIVFLGAQGAGSALPWEEALLDRMASRGKLGAVDPVALQAMIDHVGSDRVTLTGSAAMFAHLRPLRHALSRTVFCPPSTHGGGMPALYEAVARRGPTLLLANHHDDLGGEARPGIETLYAPFFPDVHMTALGSAGKVVSGRAVPAIAAVANGVPAVLVGMESGLASVAELVGIPHVFADRKMDPEGLLEIIEKRFNDYPWEAIAGRMGNLRRATLALLRETGIGAATGRRAFRPRKAGKARSLAREPLHICSISDSRYLPFLHGFIENVLALEGTLARFHVLGLDENVRPELSRRFPDAKITVYELRDLWAPDELSRVAGRSVGIRAFSSKPRLLLKVVEETSGPVVYADSDVYFFESPRAILEALDGNRLLLFPHWNEHFTSARTDGLYNAGMLAVAPLSESFLEWWGRLCLHDCSLDNGAGVVGDQGYLDFAPVFFEGVKVYREGDQDVARWNLKTLGVSLPDRFPLGPRLADGRGVRTYHAAFLDEVGVFECKYAWDQMVAFFGGWNVREGDPLLSNTLRQQRRYWLSLSRWLFARDFFSARLGSGGKGISPKWTDFFTREWGRHLLPAFAWMHRSAGRLRPRKKTDPSRLSDDIFWIGAQREIRSEVVKKRA